MERSSGREFRQALTGHEGLLEGPWLEAAGRESVLGGLGDEVQGAALRGGDGLRDQRQHQRSTGLGTAGAGSGGHDGPQAAGPLASGSDGARRWPHGG